MPFTALAANILIYGLFALGFNLVYGYLGLLSFGHAALFGTGAYFCGIAIVHFGLPWYAAIALGIAGGLAMAALIGVLAIRTRGIYFAMVTMALSQCVYYLFYQAVDWTGGENGLRGINVHVIDILGLRLDFINPLTRYYVIAAFVIAAFFVLSRILASPFGAVIEAVRENETRAKASGYDVTLTRLITFVLSGGFCGLAGALQAMHSRSCRLKSCITTPRARRDDRAARRHGDILRADDRGGGISAAGKSGVALDGALAADRRRRLHGLRAVLPGRNLGHADLAWQAMTALPSQPVILRTRGVGKVFGKFVALNNVSAEFTKGAITSIIGPNGAGKSTYFNLLSGALPPSSGSVEFEGRDVTGLPQHRFAHMGIAKSFQITNVFPQLSTLENIRVGLQALVSRYDMWRPRARLHELTEQAESCWRWSGYGRPAGARRRRWRMASSARWKSAWRWRAGRDCCCWTSRPPA